jgi:glycosyltransferase involved in cell wall biosynthesis
MDWRLDALGDLRKCADMLPRTMRPDGRLGVVVLVDRLVHGGAERVAADLATHLDPDRFATTLCVSRWPDPEHARAPEVPARLRAAAEAAGVRVLALPRRGRWDVAAWRPLVRLLRSGEVQVVHGHMTGSNVWAVLLGRAAGVPVVVAHEHSWAFTGSPVRRLLDRHLIARGSDAFVACSPEDRRRMIEHERIPPQDIALVPNGIASGRGPSPGRDVRRELGIPAGAPVAGSVGSLRPEKRFDVLVRAAAALVAGRPGARVLIAGDGPERARLEGLVRELGLSGSVLLLGARDDVPEVLAALDVAVTCSDFEGAPLSVLEYMEAALPVVATRVGGLSHLIQDGVHGLLVPRRDPAALAAAIDELLGDPARRAAMGRAGRERRRSEFSLEVMVGRVEALYERLYADSPRRSVSFRRRSARRRRPARRPRAR